MFDRSIFVRRPSFSEEELAALNTLRTRCLTTRQGFTARELAHLRFMRWLVHRPEWNRALDQPVGVGALT